jgi:hypothetical protein
MGHIDFVLGEHFGGMHYTLNGKVIRSEFMEYRVAEEIERIYGKEENDIQQCIKKIFQENKSGVDTVVTVGETTGVLLEALLCSRKNIEAVHYDVETDKYNGIKVITNGLLGEYEDDLTEKHVLIFEDGLNNTDEMNKTIERVRSFGAEKISYFSFYVADHLRGFHGKSIFIDRKNNLTEGGLEIASYLFGESTQVMFYRSAAVVNCLKLKSLALSKSTGIPLSTACTTFMLSAVDSVGTVFTHVICEEVGVGDLTKKFLEMFTVQEVVKEYGGTVFYLAPKHKSGDRVVISMAVGHGTDRVSFVVRLIAGFKAGGYFNELFNTVKEQYNELERTKSRTSRWSTDFEDVIVRAKRLESFMAGLAFSTYVMPVLNTNERVTEIYVVDHGIFRNGRRILPLMLNTKGDLSVEVEEREVIVGSWSGRDANIAEFMEDMELSKKFGCGSMVLALARKLGLSDRISVDGDTLVDYLLREGFGRGEVSTEIAKCMDTGIIENFTNIHAGELFFLGYIGLGKEVLAYTGKVLDNLDQKSMVIEQRMEVKELIVKLFCEIVGKTDKEKSDRLKLEFRKFIANNTVDILRKITPYESAYFVDGEEFAEGKLSIKTESRLGEVFNLMYLYSGAEDCDVEAFKSKVIDLTERCRNLE